MAGSAMARSASSESRTRARVPCVLVRLTHRPVCSGYFVPYFGCGGQTGKVARIKVMPHNVTNGWASNI